eukprot:CAMPEP_0115831046 /NCGR_PEP_ID=MMETSP0287-20121206/1936_1 /TAXON_ID=412157 /ORGANISM="Chrysochromulina rotalis, Strain UIO044" /LENGTH=111 /DNA_ID=CAMNT_0003284379 /DNA_START=233 /DNA_END=568 /DNA_ORIENTATION=+
MRRSSLGRLRLLSAPLSREVPHRTSAVFVSGSTRAGLSAEALGRRVIEEQQSKMVGANRRLCLSYSTGSDLTWVVVVEASGSLRSGLLERERSVRMASVVSEDNASESLSI